MLKTRSAIQCINHLHTLIDVAVVSIAEQRMASSKTMEQSIDHYPTNRRLLFFLYRQSTVLEKSPPLAASMVKSMKNISNNQVTEASKTVLNRIEK
jgi:hypothetical protein